MSIAPRIPREVPHQRRQDRPGDDWRHIANVKKLPCVVCGCNGGEAHHLLRIGEQLPKGMARRNEDKWAIPLCLKHHRGEKDSAHGHGNDEQWLAGKGIDGRALARALWKNRGDLEAMERVVFRAHQGVRL